MYTQHKHTYAHTNINMNIFKKIKTKRRQLQCWWPCSGKNSSRGPVLCIEETVALSLKPDELGYASNIMEGLPQKGTLSVWLHQGCLWLSHSHSIIWGIAVFQFCLVPGDGRDIDEDGVPMLSSTTEKLSGIRLTESMSFNQDFIMKTILCLIEKGLGLPFVF